MQWFTYILETGASWAGTIGSADIVVTLDGIDVDWLDEIDPRARVKGKTLRWRFRNFEPGLLGSPKTIYFSWLSTQARAERERRRKDVGAWDE